RPGSRSSWNEAHAIAGAEQRGLLASRIEHDRIRRADQAPSARRDEGIYAGLPLDDGDAPRRYARSRRRQPRRDDPRIEPRAVRPPGQESEEHRAVLTSAVERDELVHRYAGAIGNIGEVRPVVARRDLDDARRGVIRPART